MFGKIILASAMIACFAVAQAQETLYLIKGNEVVAKYRVGDVDYASFKLPEGVTDNTPDFPEVQNINYKSATGAYYGTIDGMADFQIQLSTNEISDESCPVSYLYLQFTGPAADYKDLKFAEGSYTVGGGERSPFTFYAGVREITPDGEAVGGTMTLDRPFQGGETVSLVTGGSFNISVSDGHYVVAGLLQLEGNNILQFSYEGECVIDNNSDEKDPAEEIPLPESRMEDDIDLDVVDAYVTVYDNAFADLPDYRYVYLMLYGDYNYAKCLDLGLLVKRSAAGDVMLPKGIYPVIARNSSEFGKSDFFASPAFQVKGEVNVADYGCWYTDDNYYKNPLVAGEIEVLEDSSDLSHVSVRVTVYDNAGEPHSVKCTYSGRLESI